jgi:protein SCO1/2
MFTSCPGICPTMTEELKKVFEAFPDQAEFKVVAFTVDPNIDTPDVLKRYAESHGIVSDRWHFLTGDVDILHTLAAQRFKVGSLTNIMDHSSNFILVDRQGNIRGYYDSLEAEKMTELIADIKKLL